MSLFSNFSPKQLRRAATLKEKISSLESKLDKLLGNGSPVSPAPAPRKRRKMSAASRARMAAAAKARWKKAKKAGKNSL